MRVWKINNVKVLCAVFLILMVPFGCATNRQLQALEKEIKQLRDIVQQNAKAAKVKTQEYYRLSAQNANKAEAAASRAEKAASKAEAEATKAESSAEILSIFLYEGRNNAH